MSSNQSSKQHLTQDVNKGLFMKLNVARRTEFVSRGEGVGANVILFVTSRKHYYFIWMPSFNVW